MRNEKRREQTKERVIVDNDQCKEEVGNKSTVK
jgi:hypothetical protein